MMKLHYGKAMLFVSACMLPVVASCKATPFRVELAPGFSGVVTISCETTGTDFQTVGADGQGNGQARVCPLQPTDIVVIRDGKRVTTEGSMSWMTTGDGILVGLKFQVK